MSRKGALKLNGHDLKHSETYLVHFHACWIPIVTKSDNNSSIFLRKDGLIHLPSVVQMRKHVRHLRSLKCSCSNYLLKQNERSLSKMIQRQVLLKTRVQLFLETGLLWLQYLPWNGTRNNLAGVPVSSIGGAKSISHTRPLGKDSVASTTKFHPIVCTHALCCSVRFPFRKLHCLHLLWLFIALQWFFTFVKLIQNGSAWSFGDWNLIIQLFVLDFVWTGYLAVTADGMSWWCEKFPRFPLNPAGGLLAMPSSKDFCPGCEDLRPLLHLCNNWEKEFIFFVMINFCNSQIEVGVMKAVRKMRYREVQHSRKTMRSLCLDS